MSSPIEGIALPPPVVRSIGTQVLVGDRGERRECWCINGNVYFPKTGWTEAQARWAFLHHNFVMTDAHAACPAGG